MTDTGSRSALMDGASPQRENEAADRRSASAAGTISILFPCLNEAAAIGESVRRAAAVLEAEGVPGEILVIDNGSTDGSAEIARAHGARVVSEPRRGYGSALRRGLLEAEGEFIVLLDADGTYPLERVGDFVRPLREEGVDLVIGNRFAGEMERGAMPFLNRYIGNPILSGMTRLLFGVPLTDIHCGMRAIRRERVRALNLVMPGMEFATEMIVKALDLGMRVKEVPIPYRPRIGPSKLNPLRDAWRHTEYMLVFSPALLFLVPGVLLLAAGLTVQLLLLSGPKPLFFRTWDVHTNLAGLAMSLCGSTLLALGVVCSTYADSIGMHFRHSAVARVAVRLGDVPLRGVGVVFLLLGAGLWLRIIGIWVLTDFGTLAAVADLSAATSLLAAGLELLVAAFLTRIVRMGRMT